MKTQQVISRKHGTKVTPQNGVDLLRLKNELEDEIKLNSEIWTEETFSDPNEENSENFCKAVKFFSKLKKKSRLPMLNNNERTIIADTEKAFKYEKVSSKQYIV